MITLMVISMLLSPDVAKPIEVFATGCGINAVQSAKIAALDKAHGMWIHAQSQVKDGAYSENIIQYNGGVVSAYEIVSKESDCTTIKATVIPRKDNSMTTNTEVVPSDIRQKLEGVRDNQLQKQKAVKVVDNRSRAIAFTTESINYDARGEETIVTVIGKVAFQQNWLSEYEELQKLTGGFDLQDFYKPLMVNVEGMDGSKVAVNLNFNFDRDLSLYHAHRKGMVEIYPRQRDRVRLTFKVKTDKLMTVDKFKIYFI